MSVKEQYPKREKFWAMKFIRLLSKTCAAQEIGPTGFVLVSVIATTEDAAGYRRAVTYFDGQLAPIVGVDSLKSLAAARKKSVEAGWLHYEPGCKGRAGRYWSTIPEHADGIDDSPTDESEDDSTPMRSKMYVESGNESGNNRETIGEDATWQRANILTYPYPYPNTEILSREADNLTFLTSPSPQFLSWWNCLPEGMRSGQKACWKIWPEVIVEIQSKLPVDQHTAVMHLIQRTKLFAVSPRGKKPKYRWSPLTFLKDGHYDDSAESWEIDSDKQDKKESDLFGSLKRFAESEAS